MLPVAKPSWQAREGGALCSASGCLLGRSSASEPCAQRVNNEGKLEAGLNAGGQAGLVPPGFVSLQPPAGAR